jgi:nucleoside-diphosphate-sugar epimerase
MNTSPLHVVIGAGQIGPLLARRLLARGLRVRMVRRSRGASLAGVEWMYGDITDPAFAAQATSGAAVVYNCTNPPSYGKWEGVLVPLARAVREAAARAGARLVVLDCLYMYGAPPADGVLREDLPLAPSSRKGELRALLADELFAAHRRGDVLVTSGRASDYFGPGCAAHSFFGTDFFARLGAGRSVIAVGNPDLPHAFSYTWDVAEGLAVLGTDERALGQAFHLPVTWNEGSTRQLVERFAAATGGEAKLLSVPRWLLRVLGVFSADLRGMPEMLYQWESAWKLDDSRFRRTFGVGATSIERAVADTVAAYRPAALVPVAT